MCQHAVKKCQWLQVHLAVRHVVSGYQDGLLDNLVVNKWRVEGSQLPLHFWHVAAVDVLLEHAPDTLPRIQERQLRLCTAM